MNDKLLDENERLRIDYENNMEEWRKAEILKSKYFKALEEIKEIVEDFPLNELETYRNILQIIEEARNE